MQHYLKVVIKCRIEFINNDNDNKLQLAQRYVAFHAAFLVCHYRYNIIDYPCSLEAGELHSIRYSGNSSFL
jgi:hypothetical protein